MRHYHNEKCCPQEGPYRVGKYPVGHSCFSVQIAVAQYAALLELRRQLSDYAQSIVVSAIDRNVVAERELLQSTGRRISIGWIRSK
jgi:hypothetical protein